MVVGQRQVKPAMEANQLFAFGQALSHIWQELGNSMSKKSFHMVLSRLGD
jgi:hypothetical protein